MNREDAIKIFNTLLVFHKVTCTIDELEEVCKMALTALEQEPCEDCLSRKALYSALYERFHDEDASNITDVKLGVVRDFVKNFPSATPQPKKGHWIDADGDNAICSCCNRLNHLYGTYCKHCGAKMEEGEQK